MMIMIVVTIVQGLGDSDGDNDESGNENYDGGGGDDGGVWTNSSAQKKHRLDRTKTLGVQFVLFSKIGSNLIFKTIIFYTIVFEGKEQVTKSVSSSCKHLCHTRILTSHKYFTN